MSLTLTMIQFGALAVTLAVCIFLFLSAKRDIHVLEARYLRRGEDLRRDVHNLAEELKAVRQELELIEQKSDPNAAVARTLGSGVRIQALRMIRHGEGPEHISAALGLPRNEVELLIKVQRLMTDPVPELTA